MCSGEERLEAPLEDTAREHDAVLAFLAPQADVSAQPDDAPIGAAAGVRLPQANDVAHVHFDELLQAMLMLLGTQTRISAGELQPDAGQS